MATSFTCAMFFPFQPLQEEIFENTVISSLLGKLAQQIHSNFSCGGTVSEVSSVSFTYKKESGVWSTLHLPAEDSTDVQEFLAACSTASFGVGGETVTDKAYRNALKLEPDCFHTSFVLAGTDILSNVCSIMSVGSGVRAELYKMNVYSTGGFFRAHVDTPRSNEMFGSLVVCLPSEFTGGELVTQHHGQQVKFDWSSDSPRTHWAAFFSDVEHEVLPVTSGHRITLTYNLYHALPFRPQSFNPTVSPLYRELQAALQTPHFLREGGTLGFFCQHKYVETTCRIKEEDEEKEEETKKGEEQRKRCSGSSFCLSGEFLKGADMIIYQVSKSLGLSIEIKPIMKGMEDEYILPSFRYTEDVYFDSQNYYTEIECLRSLVSTRVKSCEDTDIHWCIWSRSRLEPIVSGMHYGNEETSLAYYQSAALLLTVPGFTSDRGKLTPDRSEDTPPTKKQKVHAAES